MPLRVVLIGDQPTFSLYGSTLRSIAVGLIDEQVDVTVLSLGTARQTDYLPCPPVRIVTELRGYHEDYRPFNADSREVWVRAPRVKWINLLLPHRRVKRLAETLRPFKPTLLHALSETHASLTRRISKYLHLPYIVSSFRPHEGALSASLYRCGGIYCYDSHRARYLRGRYPDMARRIHRLTLGTHVTHEPGSFQHKHRLRTIGYFGPLIEGQGLAHLLNAIYRLKEIGHEPVLMLYGQGHYERELREQVRHLNLHNEVHFVPPVESFMTESNANKQILRGTDIVVQTGPAPIWQVEILEAMSAGALIVSTNSVGCDLIRPGKTAVVVPFQDTDALTDALAHFLQQPEEAHLFTTQGQLYLKKHYRPSTMITQLRQGYHRALALYREIHAT